MNASKLKGLFAVAAASTLVAVGLAVAQPEHAQNDKKKQEGEKPAQVGRPAHAEKKATVGEAAPDFTLTDLEGKEYKLADLTKDGKVVVLEWFNPDCPYIVKHHKTFTTMEDIAEEYKDRGVVWLAVNSGDPSQRNAQAEYNKQKVKEFNMTVPVALDADGKVGKAYGAKATPQMFIIDSSGVLAYAGAIDNDRSPDKLGDVNYVRQALDEILAGETVSEPETRPYGCNIKYAKAD